MESNIYQKIYDSRLDRELETILIKLLRYNLSPVVEVPVLKFLQEYVVIRDDFWNQFAKCPSFDMAFEMYYHYSKSKCALIDSLLDDLNFTLNYDPLRGDLSILMKDGLTF